MSKSEQTYLELTGMLHTPGPWRWIGEGILANETDDEILPGNLFDEADARLIAAAPELLAALDACWGMLYLATETIDKARRQQYDGVRPTDLHVIDLESCRSAYNAARAAIAKARGNR